jgi:uncharacterized protein (DUF1684 family)
VEHPRLQLTDWKRRVLAMYAAVREAAGDPAACARFREGEPTRFSRIGFVRPVIRGEEVSLAVYWLEGYGGGLFLPFRDALAGDATYGGGRYLLDTVKGADLGAGPDGRLVLDFNYAYNPSCAYDPRWSCPLAPAENRLAVPVEAGERMRDWR